MEQRPLLLMIIPMILPFAGIGLGFFALWLRYKRHSAIIHLFGTYIAQGKEPPQELLSAIRNDAAMGRGGSTRAWRMAVIFLSLAIGFGVAHFLVTPDITSHGGLLIPTIIFGALAIGSTASALIQGRLEKNERSAG